VAQALGHIVQLDAPSLEKLLSAAAVELPRQAFLQTVIMPLFMRIGEMWREGKIKIVCEHMASVVVRSMLYDMMKMSVVAETAPGIVVATPVGQWHELGALASALTALESGWRVFYFGPNLPSEEIVYAVKKLDARVLALSLSHRLDDNRIEGEMRRIRQMAGGRLHIIVGGGVAAASSRLFRAVRAIVVNDLEAFRSKLESLSRGEKDE
jgi:methanogenic corrinoid protein MtbC1